MIITLIGLMVLIAGMLVVVFEWCDLEIFGGFLIFFGALTVVICIICIVTAPVYSRQICLEYEQDKVYIESLYNEETISLEERMKVIDLIIEDNNIINKHRIRNKSLAYSWFYPKSVGQLEIFDLTKIEKIKNEIVLEENNK